MLIAVTPSDPTPGVTNTSAASIDPRGRNNNITIYDNDYPYGLMQFWEEVPENIAHLLFPIPPLVQATTVRILDI